VKAIPHQCVGHCLNATYRQYLEYLGTLRKIFCSYSISVHAWPNYTVYHEVQTIDFSLNRM